MPSFFIDRPIFAWVIAIFIMTAGLLAIPQLPVSQYPNVAPPQVAIYANYPGASPESIYQSVTRLIEEEINGAEGVLYFESTSDATGSINIDVTFEPGTDPALAAVDLQNRLKRVEPRLPQVVMQQGIQIEESSSGFLMIVALTSTDPSVDELELGDYVSRNVINELRRIDGVGRAQLFAPSRSLRVWLDPERLVGYDLSPQDAVAAIRAQNAQVASGALGAAPSLPEYSTSALIVTQGQLESVEEFSDIILRAQPDGSVVRLADVARIELGADSYTFSSRLNQSATAALGIRLSSQGNAMATSQAVRDKMEELSQYFPPGFQYDIPNDTAPFVRASISKVITTFIEAVVLVFLVMYLFLQNIRYTVIPTLVVPIALLGTGAVMLAAGFSINVLSMFAMVLAIGILVDDAIVVVENVERIMAEEGLSPREATRKAMKQISGAVIGITLVLCSVFIPMAFFPGAVGIIYKQFSLTMATSILFSAFLALSLTPALCATFLRPITHHEKKGFFGWFERLFSRSTQSYGKVVDGMLHKPKRSVAVYLATLGALLILLVRLPTSFLPDEDQGRLFMSMQAPPEATDVRMDEVIRQAEEVILGEEAVRRVVTVRGFSFSGQGQNAAMGFVTLKPWSERGEGNSAQEIAGRAMGQLSQIRDGFILALSPPPIQGLGSTGGFAFRLQDRTGQGQEALAQARDQLLQAASDSPVLSGLFVEGLPQAAQLELLIDREQAHTWGVQFGDLNQALSSAFGSSYVNDFPNRGRMQRVVVQADGSGRMKPEHLLDLHVRSTRGELVPVRAFASTRWMTGPTQVVGYNGYPAVRISGNAAPGYSSGDAIAEMERLAAQLPAGFAFEWSGQSLQEIQAGSQSLYLIILSIFFVFLCLAALYESWKIPFSVMLVVPLGAVGAVLAVLFRGMDNDVYFKVGLITIIGLSAKNAILIVEFAKSLVEEGKSVFEAASEAARIRFRPIVMTSLAFILGVFPLAIASGASAASQQAIGTGVLGGMITATFLGVVFAPLFFVLVMNFLAKKPPTAPAPLDPAGPEIGNAQLSSAQFSSAQVPSIQDQEGARSSSS